MGKKRKESNITSVMYSYVGTDDQFDDFLKMIIHDYLSVIIRIQINPLILLLK